jgi:FKBP-type peptidyl-prolyl cis-trans isomerase
MAWPRVRPNPAGIVHMTALPRTALAAALLLPVVACGGGTNQVNEVTTFEARAAYAIGQDVGNSLRASGVELDFDALVQGLRDALDEVEQPLLDETGSMQAIQEFQMQAQQAMMAQQEAAGAENRAEGEAFLAENATREGG